MKHVAAGPMLSISWSELGLKRIVVLIYLKNFKSRVQMFRDLDLFRALANFLKKIGAFVYFSILK